MTGSLLARVTARLMVAFLVFLAFSTGVFVAGVGLHDPDTCWLLALGRLIFTGGWLPATDPYSYTFALAAGKPFVMYQWLSELLFYLAYKAGDVAALLLMAALVLTFAFISMPILTARTLQSSSSLAILSTTLLLLTAPAAIGSYLFFFRGLPDHYVRQCFC